MITRFEWDSAKSASNLRKHRIGFETATHAFSDPLALTEFDRVEGGEPRWRTFGHVGGHLIVVVIHTPREAVEQGRTIEVIRIISARKADRTERRRYEQENRHV